jgi:hypothetical protein
MNVPLAARPENSEGGNPVARGTPTLAHLMVQRYARRNRID